MYRFAGLALIAIMIGILLPRQAAARPWVQARTWIVMDADSGEVLDGVDTHRRTAMASLTKVMTALIAVERGNLQQRITIEPSDLVGESSAGLKAGEVDSLWTLLHGLLMPSGNDAAMAIARAVGGSPNADDPAARARFIGWMNERAASLGLSDTHFVNPHGLDAPGHYTSVSDLAAITRAALNYPAFVQTFGARVFDGEEHHYEHLNKLPKKYPGVIGGKTGWTKRAGLCLIEVVQRGDRRLLVVLIGSTFERWYDDAITLLNYGWSLPLPATTPERAAAVFTWWQGRYDQPVSSGKVHRSWVWGPAPDGPPVEESYAEAPDGRRFVQYFDKGRMEVTDPRASLTSGWYVTGGRLAWEMITGRHQIGKQQFETRSPAAVPLAGDLTANTPSYASLAPLLAAPPAPPGSALTQRLDTSGQVVADPALATYQVLAGAPGGPTNRGIASVFDAFLRQRGPVVIDGATTEGPLFDPPVSITGYPISEPYWLHVPVGGIPRDVLVQCFERRCLTYTPSNPDGWQVEMANIGLAYQHWLSQSAWEGAAATLQSASALFANLSLIGRNSKLGMLPGQELQGHGDTVRVVDHVDPVAVDDSIGHHHILLQQRGRHLIVRIRAQPG